MSYAFSDLTRYEASAVDATTYNITLSSGYLGVEENVDTVMAMRDASNKFGVVTGYRSGTQFIIKQYLGGSEQYLSTFGSGTVIQSAVGEQLLNRGFGVGALLVFGQSNAEGFAGPTDSRLEFSDPRITMNQYQSRDSSGNLLPNDDQYLAAPPLANYQQNGNDSVPPALHMSRELINRAGFKAIEIQEGSQGSTAFSVTGEWVQGGTHYERLKAMTLEFLNRSDSNYIAGVYYALGEADSVNGVSQAQMATYIDDTFSALKTELAAGITNGTAQSKGITNMPIVLAGMPDVFLGGFYAANAAKVQAAIQDTPNRMAFTSFLDCTGLSNADLFHHDATALRTIGRELFIPAYFAALSNNQVLGTQSVSVGVADETSAALSVVSNVGNTVAVGVAEESNTALSISATGGIQNISVGVADETSTSLAVTATVATPATADALFQKGVGQTEVSGAISVWADQVASYDITQTISGRRPALTSGTVVFDGSANMCMDIPSDLQGDRAVGATYILDLSADVVGDYILGQSTVRITTNDPISVFPMSSTAVVGDASGNTVAGAGRVILAVVIDVVADTCECWIDDAKVIDATAVGAGGTNGTPFYLGAFDFLSAPQFNFDGTFYNLAFKREPLTKAQIDQIVSNDFIT